MTTVYALLTKKNNKVYQNDTKSSTLSAANFKSTNQMDKYKY